MAGRTVTVTLSAAVGGFVSGMNQAAAAAGRLSDRLESGSKYRQSWDQVGSTLIGVGAAALAGVGVAIKTFADFDQAMSNVAATGDDARGNLDRLRETAIQVGADTAFSAREAAQGMEELLKAGVSAEDVIGGGLKGAMDLAAAGTLEVGAAAEIAATAMTQFGLSGREVPHLADLLAAGAGKAQGSVHDLGMALKQSGLVASQYGLSIEETTGSLAAFASAGLIGSDAGTSFKTMLMRLAAPTGEAASLMEDLGISMYDSNGQFVGMTNLAGQLQSSLSGMSAEQRNAAMATLFGADAVRAANVLYEQGAEGIQGWIDKVNDAGYAAETAAAKQDNLRGDLEKLAGSFESLFIKSGSGANDLLRGLVQNVEGVVDAFGELPGPVQQGALALAALAGAGALVVGMGMKLAAGLADGVSALRDLGVFAAAADPKVRNLGVQAAAAAIGLAAVAVMMSNVSNEAANATVVADYARALQDLAQTGSFAKLDAEAAKFGDTIAMTGRGISDTTGLFRAFAESNNLAGQAFSAVGSAVRVLSLGLLDARSSLQLTEQEVGKLDDALMNLAPDEAAASFSRLAQQMTEMGISTQDQVRLFDDYATSIQATADAFGITLTPAEQYAAMMGQIPHRLAAAQAAAESAGQTIEGMGTNLDKAGAAARDAAGAFMELANAMLQLSGSQIGVEAAIDAANESLKEHGRTLDITTEAGRANQSALDNIAASALRLAQAQVEAKKPADEIGASMQRNRDAFIQAAEAMGMSGPAASALADSYGLVADQAAALSTQARAVADRLGEIPQDATVTLRGEGIEDVRGNLEQVGQAIVGMPDDKQISIALPNGDVVVTTVGQLKAQLEGLPASKSTTVTAPGADQAAGQVQALQSMLTGLPEHKSISIAMPDGSLVYTTAQRVAATIRDIPDDKMITLTLSNGETVTMTAGQARDAIASIPELKNTVITADASGAVAGSQQAQGAVNGVTGKTVPVDADPSGAVGGSRTAQSSINGVQGVTREIDVDPSGAVAGSGRAQGAINSTHGVDRQITVSSNAAGAAASAQASMNAVRNVTRYITTIARTMYEGGGSALSGSFASGGLIPAVSGLPVTEAHANARRYATGGRIAGWSPHPKADNVPIWATAGEFMQPVAAVRRYGMATMEALRAGQVDPDELRRMVRGYAEGGMIRDAFTRPVSHAGSSAIPGDTARPVTHVTHNHYSTINYPVAERESSRVKKNAATAGVGVML